MRKDDGWITFSVYAGIFVVFASIAAGVNWIRASNQTAVWNREGIEITTWEVFTGSRPRQQVIELKQ